MLAKTMPDMDTRASIELLDHLEAFYKVETEKSYKALAK